ncbi:MAG TPA: hypothetical protein VHO03_15915 [Ignavibacteriales bacterium]|nr:hypothetical protein [Ignavibacteriales bacterium]
MDSTKQKIIIYLLAVSFVLLLGNIVVNRFHKAKPGMPQPGKSILTAGEINSIFEDAVCEFGVEKNWIQRKPIGTDLSGDATFKYSVKIAADLPVTLILNELNRRFLEHGLTVSSKEMRKEKTTSLKILHVKNVMLQADFVTDPEILRSTATIGLIVKDAEKLGDKEFQDFLALPENYAILLSPSDKSEKAGKLIVSQNKEYAVVLDDKIDEVRFRFDDDYSERRLNTSLRTILGAFGNAKVYMIDDMSDLYKSRQYVTIKNSFDKRKINLVPISSYTEIMSREDKDIESMFRYYCESTTSGERVFLVTARNFLQLKDMIDLYRKKGYKFVFPSQLNFGLSPTASQQQQAQTKKQVPPKKQVKKK